MSIRLYVHLPTPQMGQQNPALHGQHHGLLLLFIKTDAQLLYRTNRVGQQPHVTY